MATSASHACPAPTLCSKALIFVGHKNKMGNTFSWRNAAWFTQFGTQQLMFGLNFWKGLFNYLHICYPNQYSFKQWWVLGYFDQSMLHAIMRGLICSVLESHPLSPTLFFFWVVFFGTIGGVGLLAYRNRTSFFHHPSPLCLVAFGLLLFFDWSYSSLNWQQFHMNLFLNAYHIRSYIMPCK